MHISGHDENDKGQCSTHGFGPAGYQNVAYTTITTSAAVETDVAAVPAVPPLLCL
jgi:hypothetical protein